MSSLPPNNPMPAPLQPGTIENEQNDFIDLSQLIAFAQRNWSSLLGGVLLAMACGGALFAVLPARWQAQVTVETGQVPSGTPVSGSRGTTLIEAPAQTAVRIKQREWMNVALNSLKIPVDQPDDARAALFRSSLKATIVKNTNFIQLGVAGFSPQEARDSLVAITRTLLDAHSKIMVPLVGRMMTQLEDNTKQMVAAQTERSRLQALLDDSGKSNARIDFAPNIVAINQLANQDAQIRQITAERAELQDALAPSRTYPTRIIDAVYVEPRPIFPKLSLFLAVGALLGLLAGIALAWYRERKK